MDILLTILTVALRKILVMGLVFAGWRFFDYYYCRAFDTDEILKDNPIAVALLLGMFALSMALA